MAQQYASYNNVIYEICNEPCNGATWGDVKFYASEVISSIRSYDKDAVILIGTPKWSRVISVYSGVLRRGRRANRYRKHSRKKKVCIE